MTPETVTVTAGGAIYSAFERVDVDAAFNEAARSFKLDIAAALGGTATSFVFGAGTEVSISANGDLLAVGYVDRYKPALNEHQKAMIMVGGRGKGQDAIDCSAVHPTGHFENQTPLQIAQTLDQFGIGFSSDQQMTPLPFYHLTPGESVFRCIEKLCRQEGLLLAAQPDGSIKLTKLQGASNSPLIEGVNCKALEGDHNWSGRHSHVTVRGQRPIGTGAANLHVEQTATDAAVSRYRPLIVVHDGDTDNARAKKRAQYRIASEAGHSVSASITVQGFHDDAGQLWTPGNTTFLDSDFLAIHQLMGIKKIKYRQDRKTGSLAHLSLVDPAALGGKSGQGGGGTNAAWNTDAGGDGDGGGD